MRPVGRARVCVFSSRRRHTRFDCDWSSDVCSSDLPGRRFAEATDGRVRPVNPVDEVEEAAVLISGVFGSGKSAVAEEIVDLIEQRGLRIGRGSGRGKGERSVEAGSLKKKKKNEAIR